VSFRLVLICALLFGLGAASLTALPTIGVRAALARDWASDVPSMALLAGVLLIGVGLAVVATMLRDIRRSYRDFQVSRRAWRAQTLGDPPPEAPTRLGELAHPRGDTPDTLGHLQPPSAEDRPERLLAAADDHRRAGRWDEAIETYRRVLARYKDDLIGLRGWRDVAAERGRWADALEAQERLLRVAPRDDRAVEEAWLAGIQYELGRSLLAGGDTPAAVSRFKDALRTRSDFLPATLLLGDVHLKSGDVREALRVWERALEAQPAESLLSRIAELHRTEGRPARMIALYEQAVARHPENLAIAFGLGRIYFELAMLDEAAEQFQKLEVQAPDLASVHAYLGAIFERHGQLREACEEYRGALRFREGFEWPHRCVACGAVQPSWFDRCLSCRRWNTSRA
jgi:tetratricopeptide (TPR) repeat protein